MGRGSRLVSSGFDSRGLRRCHWDEEHERQFELGSDNLKKLIIGAIFAAVSSTCAFAADLPMQAYKSAPVASQVYNWTGLYVGVNGGYGTGTQDPLTLVSGRFDRASFDISGAMFGGTMGAQIQQGFVVLGLEGDLDWANVKGNGIKVRLSLASGRVLRSISRPTSAPLERLGRESASPSIVCFCMSPVVLLSRNRARMAPQLPASHVARSAYFQIAQPQPGVLASLPAWAWNMASHLTGP